jgi:hypothetical protein
MGWVILFAVIAAAVVVGIVVAEAITTGRPPTVIERVGDWIGERKCHRAEYALQHRLNELREQFHQPGITTKAEIDRIVITKCAKGAWTTRVEPR